MVYHLILLKEFYESIPYGMEESAKLDGADNLQILFNFDALTKYKITEKGEREIYEV